MNFGGEDFVDGVDITPEGFYERLIESDALPTTSQAAPADFAEAFERLTANGDEVVCLTISSKLSGTYQSAMIAAADFEGRVRVVDTLNDALGAQILARYALRLASGGRGMDEVADELERVKGRVHIIALLDTLEYLKRGGRISAAAAAVGRGVLDKARHYDTRRRGRRHREGPRLQERGKPALAAHREARRGLHHALRPGLHRPLGRAAAKVQGGLRPALGRLCEGPAVSIVGSVVGTHAGPGAIAVAFFGKE